MTHLIKITDHITNTEYILTHKTTLEHYQNDFKKVVQHLGTQHQLSEILSNEKSELFTHEEVEIKGYLYNTKKSISKLAFELNLITINNDISQQFLTEQQTQTEQQVQYEQQTQTEQQLLTETQTQTENQLLTETEQQTYYYDQYDPYHYYYQQCYENYHAEFCNQFTNKCKIDTDDQAFGEFQSYEQQQQQQQQQQPVLESVDDFNHVKVYVPEPSSSSYPSYVAPSYSEPYVPPYMHKQLGGYGSYDNNYFSSLRTLDDDMKITVSTKKEKVPEAMTVPKKSEPFGWAPELINELKLRLSQPNAGLNFSSNV